MGDFIGAPVWFLKTVLGGFRFDTLFYDALGRFLNTAPGCFSFGTVFYDAPGRNSCKAPVLYSHRTHWAGVYGVHGVRCANVLCAPSLSMVERTGN